MAAATFRGLRYVAAGLSVELVRRRSARRTRTLAAQVVESDAAYWALRIPLETGRASSVGAAVAALAAHRDALGATGAFKLVFPQPAGLDAGAAAGTLASAASARAVVLSIAGGAGLAAGLRFTIAGQSPVYQIADASGAVIQIAPRLRFDAPAGAALDFAPVMRARYAGGGDFSVSYAGGGLAPAVVIEVEEAL